MVVPNEKWRALFSFITDSDAEGWVEYLKRGGVDDILEVHDALNFTLVNYCAYRNEASCFKVVFLYAQ